MRTASLTPSAYLVKFSWNIAASRWAAASYASGSAHVARGRLHGRDGVTNDRRQLHRLHVQPDLAGHDSRYVHHVVDDLREPRRVAVQRLEPAGGFLTRENAAAKQPRVADDRVQRRPQFVREHREELVLRAVGVLRLGVEPRILERHRRPGGDPFRQPRVVLGVGFGEPPRIDLYVGVSNLYLQVAEHVGLIGLGAFLLVIAMVLARASMLRVPRERLAWGLLASLQSATIAALAAGMFDHYFFNVRFPHMVGLFWVVLGLLSALASLIPNDPRAAGNRVGDVPAPSLQVRER